MTVNANGMEDLNVKVSDAFEASLEEYKNVSDSYVTEVPSNTTINSYFLSDQLNSMKEKLGPLEMDAIKTHRIDILNKIFEMGIRLTDYEVKDDLFGQFNLKVKDLAQTAAQVKDEQTSAALLAGLTGSIGFDGKPFFSTTHDYTGTNQSNSLSLALDATNLATALTKLETFVGSGGRPFAFGASTPILLVPSALRFTALQLVSATTVATGGTNILQGAAQVVVNPYLNSDPTRWFVLNTGRPMKPVMWQVNDPVHLITQYDAIEGHTTYMAKCRANAALSLWQLALTSKP